MLGAVGILNLLFLKAKPEYVGLVVDEDENKPQVVLVEGKDKGISFWKAW